MNAREEQLAVPLTSLFSATRLPIQRLSLGKSHRGAIPNTVPIS